MTKKGMKGFPALSFAIELTALSVIGVVAGLVLFCAIVGATVLVTGGLC